jgi:hypothetical protein
MTAAAASATANNVRPAEESAAPAADDSARSTAAIRF